jgi:hypothetical protein
MRIFTLFLLTALYLAVTAGPVFSQTAPISFGDAASFTVLAATTVTNTGPTMVSCNVGVSPGSSVTGFDVPVTVDGTLISGYVYRQVGSLAGVAQTSARLLYNDLSARVDASAIDLTGKGLGYADGVMTLSPGNYTYSSAALLKDTLILDDTGDPNAIFIIRTVSTLTTASYSKVKMKSGGNGTNVFWLIGSSATIGTYTQFCGNIIAYTSITMTTGCSTTGKLIALGAAVTMDTNTAINDNCSNSPSFSILPVTYLSFTAVCNSQNALLSWSTATGTNNNFFTVEKSGNGNNWNPAALIFGTDNTAPGNMYTYRDTRSVDAVTYYRLKRTDFTGTNSYSKTIMLVNCKKVDAPSLVLYPNPTTGEVNFLYEGKSAVASVEVYNAIGEKVYSAAGFQSKLNLSDKPNGIYYVRMHLKIAVTIQNVFVKNER